MSRQTLLLIEVTGIQEYVFGSNELAQNIGASELVRQAHQDWLYARMNELGLKHNLDCDGGFRVLGGNLQRDGLDAEVIYAGGGNALLRLADADKAKALTQALTRHALQKARGLQLMALSRPFDPEQHVLRDVLTDMRRALKTQRLQQAPSVPLLGLGVTASCTFTGLPAVDTNDEGLPISAEVRHKLDAEEAGKERLKAVFPQVAGNHLEFVYNFDDLGSEGESSYLAVIHADGNDMGKRIEALGAEYGGAVRNEEYIAALRRWSQQVQDTANEALRRTVDMLLDPHNLKPDPKDGRLKLGGVVPIPKHQVDDQTVQYLPFRPIVFGGDDVTVVCEGRLGLTLARKYLTELAAQDLSDHKPAHARAGVAVVKTHYPFSRAYELAEALCKSAKDYVEEVKEPNGLTALDWHFAVTGLVRPLADLRRREYTARQGSLLMRPLRLTPGKDWRSWETFTGVMGEFLKPRSEKGEWAGRRNKIKALREALREGPPAVRAFLRAAGAKLPVISAWPDMEEQGWHGSSCGYWDAVEALDFYVPLEGA
jgi:hypothetical protein